MRFIVATRSFLAEVGVGAEWNLVDFHPIARGQHYGIALPRSGHWKRELTRAVPGPARRGNR